MSFRTKLLLVVLLTIFASVSVVAYAVTYYTRSSFEAMDAQRTEALVAQFKKEFVQSGAELSHQVKNISDAGVTDRMAIDLSHANADASLYARDAFGAAQEHGLNYVEMVNSDGIHHLHVVQSVLLRGTKRVAGVKRGIGISMREIDGHAVGNTGVRNIFDLVREFRPALNELFLELCH